MYYFALLPFLGFLNRNGVWEWVVNIFSSESDAFPTVFA
jgi:hypothetical protein